MSWWNAKYRNNHGEYEITFGSKYREKTKAVEKFCQAIIDKKIDGDNAAAILEQIIKAEPCPPDCRWFGTRHQKCSCCRRNWNMKDNYERRADNG